MPDTHTVVTRNTWGSRIRKSSDNALIGLVLIPFCLWWLWTNEGRPDLSEIAKVSVAVAGNTIDASNDGLFVSLSGTLVSTEQLGDEPYMMPNKYIALTRTSEMYAWNETTSTTETVDEVGGGSTTTTTYTYDTGWTTSPQSSSSFEFAAGHENPSKSIESAYLTVSEAHVGAYQIDPTTITLPEGQAVAIQPDARIADYGYVQNGGFLYNGSPSSPQVGDIRLSYAALPNAIAVTVLGKINDGTIDPYTDKIDPQFSRTMYRVFLGSRDDAIALLHNEYVYEIWFNRILGVVGLWIALGLLTDPIIKILDVVKVVGSVAEAIMRTVNAIVAIAVGGATIIISMVFHNVYLLIVVIGCILIGALVYLRSRFGKTGLDKKVPAVAKEMGEADTQTDTTSST
jgi:hypothetical protein